MTPLLDIRDLDISIGGRPVVTGASLAIAPGEACALVGESGSGKTLLAKTLVGLSPPDARIAAGEVAFEGEAQDTARLASLRRRIAFIFQEPLTSLNPALRVETQLTEVLGALPRAEKRARAIAMLERVRLPDPQRILRRYPHELSGGQRQRVMIATALMTSPRLLIADEPTTALDAIVKHEMLALMREACAEAGAALLVITHDLGLVARFADRLHVMEAGRIVEAGPARQVIASPAHPYTRRLLDAVPKPAETAPTDCSAEAPLLTLDAVCVEAPRRLGARGRPVKILDGVSLEVRPGEVLAVIGESGSGKTTLGRACAGFTKVSAGQIRFAAGRRQFVWQDPFGSLDPRMTVGDIVAEGLLFDRAVSRAERGRRAQEALEQVGLDGAHAARFPHQLSGGQRQRVSIARAIAVRPDLIIADEPVSALDLTVQKKVLDLFLDLRRRLGFACLLISHDMGVVEHMADRVAVLWRGQLVEEGPRDRIFADPQHPYTRRLIEATRAA